MVAFSYAEINIVGIVLLLLLLNNMNRSIYKSRSIDQRIFNGCMIMNILIFLLDTGMWLLDGVPGAAMESANYVVTTLYYISNPLICFLWLMYTDFKIYESKLGLLKRIRLYAVPCVISAALSLASPFTGWLFSIDEKNGYMRGPYFWMMALACLIYLVLSCGMSIKDIYKNGWEGNKSLSIHLVVFPIGIIAASVIQIMFFGVSIIWVCAMLALASIYINIQNGEISTDYLTGLYNRRRLDLHLKRIVKARRKEHLLFAIMLDLDEFKSINDNYGHIAGDSALMKMAELLRQTCKGSDDFIARIGGDEFVILGERTRHEEIKKLMEEIYSNAFAYNQSHQLPYALMPSMGYTVFSKDDTIDSFLATADREMYRSKQERKLEHSKDHHNTSMA
ncbi:MAG: GGDEF domain-containing protein [Bacillota bacterium]|nr:GGDEF domain-containing protein [Bacillota bacterium]